MTLVTMFWKWFCYKLVHPMILVCSTTEKVVQEMFLDLFLLFKWLKAKQRMNTGVRNAEVLVSKC